MAKQVDTTYGNALFELALEENKLDALYDEVLALIDILKENGELIKLLSHPHINKDAKKEVVSKTFEGKVSAELTGLIAMIVDKDHAANLIQVLEYFIRLVKKEKNIGVAAVTSAAPLTDEQKGSIEKRLIETTAFDTMETSYFVDSSLIGGLVIRIDDRVVDSSIKTKIENLAKSLA